MKTMTLAILLMLACTGAAFGSETQLEKAANVFQEVMNTPDRGIPQDLLGRAVCVGIVPSELKAAFIFGGTYGRGVLVCRKHGNGAWGAPSEFGLGGGSFGFQIGGKATDVVFLVMNEAGARKLVADKVKLGAEVSVAGGPVGRTAQGATDAELHAEILSYSRTRGLFAGLSLSGSVFRTDHDGNRRLYGRSVTSKDILIRDEVKAPPEAAALDRELDRYSPSGGHEFAKL
jgi:SH3 domain-containing YSC84-like protein 1